ncbi:MAG: hypothetical protein JWP01_4078 [Myxococcales bacterium]|nr:hypothetical protein [Myxococcales bacterium]
MKPVLFASLLFAALGCKNEPARDADPCARATANASRLVADEPRGIDTFGEHPLSVERCRAISSTETVKCIGYASSWSELRECSPDLVRPVNDVARNR